MSTQTADRGLQPIFAQRPHPLTSSIFSRTDELPLTFRIFSNTAFLPKAVPWQLFGCSKRIWLKPLGAWADVAGSRDGAGHVTFGQSDIAKEPLKRAKIEQK